MVNLIMQFLCNIYTQIHTYSNQIFKKVDAWHGFQDTNKQKQWRLLYTQDTLIYITQIVLFSNQGRPRRLINTFRQTHPSFLLILVHSLILEGGHIIPNHLSCRISQSDGHELLGRKFYKTSTNFSEINPQSMDNNFAKEPPNFVSINVTKDPLNFDEINIALY